MPNRDLTQWQVGTEATWGTGVAATAILMGMTKAGKLVTDNQSAVYQDVRNSLGGSALAGLEQVGGKGNYEAYATFEDICYFLDNAFGQASPTGTGPYVRTYSGATSALPSPRKFTVIYGNTQTGGGVYTMTGGLVNTLKLVGASGKPTMISGDLIGKQVDTSGSFAALSARTVSVIMGLWSLYIDAWGGTVGTTQITTTMMGFTLDVNLKRSLTRSEDALAPDGWEQLEAEAKLALTLRFNASTKTQVDALVGQTDVVQKLIRLKATSGTKIAQFDFAGTLTNDPELYSEDNGLLTTTLEFTKTYSSAMSNWFAASITNGVSTLA